MPTRNPERGRSDPKPTRTVVRTTLKDTASPSLLNLQNAIKSAGWEVNAKVLSIVSLVCGTEQAWRTARSQLLTLFNGEDKTQRLIFSQFGLTVDEADNGTDSNGEGPHD